MKSLVNKSRWKTVISLSLATSIALFVIYKLSNLDEFSRLKEASQKISQLKQIKNSLDKAVLKSRFHYLRDYDFFASELRKKTILLEEISHLLLMKDHKISSTSQERVKKIDSEFNAIEDKIELFKSKNSIYENSERYLPALLEELTNEQTEKHHHLKEKIGNLSTLLLSYKSYPSEELKKKIIEIQEKISIMSPLSIRPKTILISRHLNILLSNSEPLDRIVAAILSSQIETVLSEFEHEVAVEIEKAGKTARIYYLVMAFFITTLVGLIVVVFFKIQAAKSDLEKKVAERTSELTKEKEVANRALEAKSRFLATMSHEIRTPMNAVLSCTNLLLDTAREPENVNLLKTIATSGDTLLTLINDILDFSKIESGKIDLESEAFSLKQNIDDVIDLLNSKASEKGILLESKVSSDAPQWIKGDVTRFRQILTNLVGNAIKFSKNKILVSVTAQSKGEQFEILVAVEDNGIGMPEEAKSKLFKDFNQVDASTTRKFGGTGLGLAICKGLTDAMGGRIWAESEPGKGSTFSFTFLAEEAEPQVTQKKEKLSEINPDMAKQHPLKILMAEDNTVNQMVAKKMISKLGYRIDVVANGLEAVDAVKNGEYDVVLMDQHMPEMDGLDATKEIRKFSPTKPKVFALTASAFKEDKDRCLEAGMNGFMTKPIDLNELVTSLYSCEPNEQMKRSS